MDKTTTNPSTTDYEEKFYREVSFSEPYSHTKAEIWEKYVLPLLSRKEEEVRREQAKKSLIEAITEPELIRQVAEESAKDQNEKYGQKHSRDRHGTIGYDPACEICQEQRLSIDKDPIVKEKSCNCDFFRARVQGDWSWNCDIHGVVSNPSLSSMLEATRSTQ